MDSEKLAGVRPNNAEALLSIARAIIHQHANITHQQATQDESVAGWLELSTVRSWFGPPEISG